MKLLNETQTAQVSGGSFSSLMQEMIDGAVAGWKKPFKSTLMPYPFNGKDMLQHLNNAFEGALKALGKHFQLKQE